AVRRLPGPRASADSPALAAAPPGSAVVNKKQEPANKKRTKEATCPARTQPPEQERQRERERMGPPGSACSHRPGCSNGARRPPAHFWPRPRGRESTTSAAETT